MRQFRTTAGLSQETLAEQAGLSVRGISDLERGARRFPRLETVRMLADALDLNSEDRTALLTAARPELMAEHPAPLLAPKPKRTISPRPLPIPPTRLIGRETEIGRIVDLFRAGDTRLITLTGQGGIGKSRLGLAIARGFSRELGGRVAFLELAAVRDVTLVPTALATQLGVSPEAGESVTNAIAVAIGQEPTLLVVDNWEHVIEAAPVLSTLLGYCEGLWILATSRERLRLRGEWEMRIDPLFVPGPEDSLEQIATSPAVQLFVQRAGEAMDGFVLDADNTSIVLEIVRRLDGIPLAIELTAAHARLLTPEALLGRLEERFQLLIEGPRDLPERLQTMHSAIGWSVDLLDDDERQLFDRLSVFTGGFTFETATSMLAQLGEEIDPLAIEALLGSLVDKSLVRSLDSQRNEPRFTMYETIREYAATRLIDRNESGRIGHAHATYFLQVAELSEAGLTSPNPMPTFTVLETEIANLRAALRFLQTENEIELALRITSALAWFWTEPRFIPEGRRWLESLLNDPRAYSVPAELRIRALIAAGDLVFWQGDLDTSMTFHSEALALLRDSDNDRMLATVLRSLANVALERGDFAETDRLLKESNEHARSAGNFWEVAAVANLLGLNQTMQGFPDQAIGWHQEAARIWRELGDTVSLFDALASLGLAQLNAARFAESARTFLEALSLAVETDDILQIEWCIRAGALIAARIGNEPERAIRLFAASETILEENGIAMRVRVGEMVDQAIEELRERLEPDRFTRAWQTGVVLGQSAALAEARSVFGQAIV